MSAALVGCGTSAGCDRKLIVFRLQFDFCHISINSEEYRNVQCVPVFARFYLSSLLFHSFTMGSRPIKGFLSFADSGSRCSISFASPNVFGLCRRSAGGCMKRSALQMLSVAAGLCTLSCNRGPTGGGGTPPPKFADCDQDVEVSWTGKDICAQEHIASHWDT